MERLMRTRFVAPALAIARGAGEATEAIRKRHGLPPEAETDPSVVLPVQTLRDLLDDIAERIGSRFLGLRIAAAVPRGAFALPEFAIRAAPTLREALAQTAENAAVDQPVIEATFRVQAGEGIYDMWLPGEPEVTGRHANEAWMAIVSGLGQHLCDPPVRPTRVWMGHPAPPRIEPLQEAFGTRRIHFEMGSNGIAFAEADLDAAVSSGDPALRTAIRNQIASSDTARGLTSSVRRALHRGFETSVPTLASTARLLGMSSRTLQRRLADEGARFGSLKDEVRAEIAKVLVRRGDLGLETIAAEMGYSDLGAFLRAFKRWTGMTPTQYRR
ncbi:MAG: AraC family transcriptional regulator ligand-binding domain-containing protein [Myxococcota bacterium]